MHVACLIVHDPWHFVRSPVFPLLKPGRWRELKTNREPQRKDILKAMHTVLLVSGDSMQAEELKEHYKEQKSKGYADYGSFLYDESEKSPLKITGSPAEYNDDSPVMNGYEILNKYFDSLFSTNKKVIAIGEPLCHMPSSR